MEVCCEPAIFVKAPRVRASQATLHLTPLDRSRNYYFPCILFYQGGKHFCSVDSTADDDEEQEQGDATVFRAIQRGVEAMVEHYPWAAGRLCVVKKTRVCQLHGEEEQGDLEVYIDEDGGPGVRFVCARVNRRLCSLGDVSHPDPAFEPLFASLDETAPFHSRPLVALQVSRFQCGGFCVSMSSNHVLFDGLAASLFLQNMGSCARGKGLCSPLDLAPRELRFSPRNLPFPTMKCSMNYRHNKDLETLRTAATFFCTQQLVATNLKYTQHDIEKLRLHALSNQKDCKRGFHKCTRLQVIMAHLWRAEARYCMTHEEPLKEFPLFMGVNVRERIMASIPKNYMGNGVVVATASATLKTLSEESLASVVELIQDAIDDITPERVQSYVDHLESLGSTAQVTNPSLATRSLANLGFYDIDFGWGKPIYFGRHFEQMPNFICIMDGSAQHTSLNIHVAFNSQVKLLIFQDALQWELSR